MDYLMNRKLNKTGKHYVYYATINGKRLTKTNYIRKWEARTVVRRAIEIHGIAKLQEMFS